MSIETKYVGQIPVGHDIEGVDAGRMLLESAKAALAEAPPGDWEVVGDPRFEIRRPDFVGGTIWGQDEDGNWLGDPRDYRLYVHLKVRSESAVEAPLTDGGQEL